MPEYAEIHDSEVHDSEIHDSGIHALLERMTDTWNAGDAAGYGELFTDDADYVTFFGLHLRGRTAIEDAHRALFAGPLKGSRLTPSSRNSDQGTGDHGSGGAVSIRLVRPDVAVVVATGGSSLSGDGEPDPDRDSIITLTAVKDGREWRFASFQNTRQQPMPGRPADAAAPGSGVGR